MADVAGGLESGAGDAVEHVKGAASDVWGKFKKLPTWAKIALAIVVVLIVLLIAGVFGGGTSAASTPSTAPTPTPDPGTGGSGGSGSGSTPTTTTGNPGGGTPPPSGSGVGGGGGAAPVPESIPLSLAAPTNAIIGTVLNAAATQTAKTVANIMADPTSAAQVPVTAAQKAETPGIVTNAPQVRAVSPQNTVSVAASKPKAAAASTKKTTKAIAATKPASTAVIAHGEVIAEAGAGVRK